MKVKYQEDLVNNGDQMYESIFEKMKKNKLQIVIIGSILFLGLLIYFLFFRGNNSNEEFAKLEVDLCEAALEYESKNEGIIDKSTPGASTYVRLQKLVDENLIGNVIMDPRKKGGIFSRGEQIPLDTYIKLSVASNGEVYCDGLEDY